MQMPVLNTSGQQVSTIDLPADIFEAEVNVGLMHQLYVLQMANGRQGTHSTKTRSENNRTKAKWYRQKGTGRARHGSRNAPIFVGGGIAHGPKPRKYTKHMPKKMRRAAIRSALSALARDNQLVFVDELSLPEAKTKYAQQLLKTLVGDNSALVLVTREHEMVRRSMNNLTNTSTLLANYLNIRDLLRYDKVIVPLAALDIIKQIWGAGA